MQKKFLLLGLFFTLSYALSAQTYRYSFNNTFAEDGAVGPTLIEVQENNAGCPYISSGFSNQNINKFGGTCATNVPAWNFSRSGLTFTNNPSLIGSTYTIHIFMKRNLPISNYDRVIDFSNGISDNGVYTIDGCFAFYNGGLFGNCPNLTGDNFYLYSIVRNGINKEIRLYINGVLSITFTDTNDDFAPATNTTNILFFNDDGCDYSAINGNTVKYISLSPLTSTLADVQTVWSTVCPSVLPLRFIDFSANSLSDNSVLLKWITDNETNTSHFDLERSIPGGNFSKIGNIVTNNITTRSNYSFTDRQPFSGTNLYRLKIYDIDGQYKYSNILKVSLSGKQKFEVFPNPAKDVITINGIKTNQLVRLLNSEGKELIQKISIGQSITMDVSKFPTGMYIVTYFDGTQTQRQKIVKQ